MKMIVAQAFLCYFIFSCGTNHQDLQSISYENYVIRQSSGEDESAVVYFYNHFKKRTAEGVVLMNGQDAVPTDASKTQFISIVLDTKLESDYVILKEENNLTLKANSKKTLYWLFYQYFKELSEVDGRVIATDLPPAIVSFKSSKVGNFAFNYREPYLQPNLVEDYNTIINTNNVENDWGIWGHQLFNLINKNPNDDCYSVIDGMLNKNQLCFSNPATYSFLENYIIDNFGTSSSIQQKFVISPADNNLVCMCSKCAALGNKKGDASFSVLDLLKKMANRFPNYQFFTIDYLSVHTPPSVQLPKNTGIIISSIDLPRKVTIDLNNSFVKEFRSKVDQWKNVCSTVYVWDYVSNFDDYLTPFPTLLVCQTNFNFYKKLKINGIFANGAGYDYSTFSEVHTYVIAALMQDPTLDVNELVTKFCNYYYGSSGNTIANYIIGLEIKLQQKNSALELYSGVQNKNGTYLDASEFFRFYSDIEQEKGKGSAEIKMHSNQLYTGLTYSAMQIQLSNAFDKSLGFARQKGTDISIRTDFKSKFEYFTAHYKSDKIWVTREQDGNVETYLNDVENSILKDKFPQNLLNKDSFKVVSKLDEDYPDANLLTDRIRGLVTNYHNVWLIVSATDLIAELKTPNQEGLFHLKCDFLLNERLKIRAPEKMEVVINGKISKTIFPEITSSDTAKRLTLATTLSLSNTDKVKIIIYRDKTFKKFACDEIYLFK